MHHRTKYEDYIEGFHKNYNCITLWNNQNGLIEDSNVAFFKYSPENRVPKYTNPFR